MLSLEARIKLVQYIASNILNGSAIYTHTCSSIFFKNSRWLQWIWKKTYILVCEISLIYSFHLSFITRLFTRFFNTFFWFLFYCFDFSLKQNDLVYSFQNNSFGNNRVSKECVSKKFPHQEIRWIFGILRSATTHKHTAHSIGFGRVRGGIKTCGFRTLKRMNSKPCKYFFFFSSNQSMA